MKKVIVLMLAVMFTVASQAKTKDLIIEGSFLHLYRASYTVFKLDSTGNFVKQRTETNQREFYIKCDIGSKYVVQFVNHEGIVKFLVINATEPGNFVMDVDFSKEVHAVLNYARVGYQLRTLRNKDEVAINYVKE